MRVIGATALSEAAPYHGVERLFVLGEGLGEKVIGAELQELHRVEAILGVSAHRDRLHDVLVVVVAAREVLAEKREEPNPRFDARFDRVDAHLELHVEEREAKAAALDERHRLVDGRRVEAPVVVRLEELLQLRRHLEIVFDDQPYVPSFVAHRFPRRRCSIGSTTVTVVPDPLVLASRTLPSCSLSMTDCTSARPTPVP